MTTHDLYNKSASEISIYDDAMTRAMAWNVADWHKASMLPYGIHSFYSDALWWREAGGSGIYLGAIILDGERPDEEVFAGLQAVEELWGTRGFAMYDCWGKRDLTRICFQQVVKNPWYFRPPGATPTFELPQGLSIEIVETPQQLADFERASMEGFEEPENAEEAFRDRKVFEQHAVETLEAPGMVYLNARYEDKVVAGVILHVTEDMVGIYGISTLIPFRRRGYARALIHRALAMYPDLPMGVFPEPVSVPIYTDVGFVVGGEIAIWKSSKLK